MTTMQSIFFFLSANRAVEVSIKRGTVSVDMKPLRHVSGWHITRDVTTAVEPAADVDK